MAGGKIYVAAKMGAKKTVKKEIKQIKSRIRELKPELKYCNTTYGTSFATAGIVYSMVDIAQGDDTQTRSGNRVRAKLLEFNAVFTYSLAHTIPVNCRLIIFKDKEPNGVLPTTASMLSIAGEPISLRNGIYWPSKYTKVADRIVVLSADKQTQTIRIVKRLNTPIAFNGAGGTYSAIVNNGYYVYLMTDAVANYPAYLYSARVRFTDI